MEGRSSNPLILFEIILLILPLSSFGEPPMAFKTINLENKCSFPIWPAVADSMAASPNSTKRIPAVLGTGKAHRMTVDAFWSGSIWGMVGCAGKESCVGGMQNMYATKATFEFLGGIAKPDTYTVTLESGYNLPISVVPRRSKKESEGGGSWRHCSSMACTGDAAIVCPKYLQVKRRGKGGAFTACRGGCDGYLCSPRPFSVAFRKACPRAFPFSNSAAICPPSTISYTLSFCPNSQP